ncbi:MAG: 6-bladed beta-propeller, partial [Limisphaerales bacterium]
WQRLDLSQLESDPALTGWALVRWLLWPLAQPGLAQAAVLTFVLALNNFAVPSILQVKVFPAELWVSFNTQFDYGAALGLSWPLVLAPGLLLLWFRRREIAWPQLEGGVAGLRFRRQLGRGWFWGSGAVTVTLMLIAVGLPLLQLVVTAATWSELPAVLATGRSDLLNSFGYAAITATVCLGLALLSWRWRMGLVLWIPFFVPGVLLGIALIFFFNRPVLALFYQSAGIIILALTMRYLALGWHGTAHALRTADRDVSDAARLSGASGWQLMRHIQWPQTSAQLAAVWYLTYLLCLWDVETLVLIIPPGGGTAALRIFNLLHYGHTTQVNTLCLLLLALAVAPWAFWRLSRALRRHAGSLVTGTLLAGVLGGGCEPASPNEATLDSRIFSKAQVIGSRGTGLGQFNKPRSVALDADDNLYVVDMTGRVQRFSAKGDFLSFWQMPQTDKGKPKGMCRDTAGNIVVVEPHYSRVNHFTPDGKLVAQWGRNGTNAGQLFFPRSVAINAHGETYVSEYGVVDRVQRFSAMGKQFLNAFGGAGSGPGEFSRAEGLGVDTQERVYVADSCNHRIQVFSREGRFLRAYGRPGTGRGEFNYPYDVRVDTTGLQFVCEFGNSRIQVFDANDQLVEVLGGVGTAPGQFFNPWSIALDSQGNLYVADAGNHRVQKFVRRERLAAKPEVPSTNRPSKRGEGPRVAVYKTDGRQHAVPPGSWHRFASILWRQWLFMNHKVGRGVSAEPSHDVRRGPARQGWRCPTNGSWSQCAILESWRPPLNLSFERGLSATRGTGSHQATQNHPRPLPTSGLLRFETNRAPAALCGSSPLSRHVQWPIASSRHPISDRQSAIRTGS